MNDNVAIAIVIAMALVIALVVYYEGSTQCKEDCIMEGCSSMCRSYQPLVHRNKIDEQECFFKCVKAWGVNDK